MDEKMREIPTPDMPNAIKLGTPPLPGAVNPEVWHTQYGSLFARNVTVATITPILPDPAKAAGTAVVVAPGGGFMSLSMENEGWDVARALADNHGIAAFVLKYRLTQTPAALPDFEVYLGEMLSSLNGNPPRRDPEYIKESFAPQMEDAKAAFEFIRKHAAEYKIDPNRIGMVGFSAGAGLTLATAIQGAAKPAFIGTIYGPQFALNVPSDAPPLFDAYAADDELIANSGFGLIDSWRAAKRPVELHMYEQGGHGFGMYPKTTTSTGWFTAFISWLTMHGMIKA